MQVFPIGDSCRLDGLFFNWDHDATKGGLKDLHSTDYIGFMSAAEIINELPKLSEPERRAIRQVLLEIANRDEDIAICNQTPLDGALMLDRLENDDSVRND